MREKSHLPETEAELNAILEKYGGKSANRRVIKINPRNARAWNNRGRARSDQGDLAAAIADLDQAIKLDSRIVVVWSNSCSAHYLQGALDAALADCNQALKLDARNVNAWSVRGLALQDKGDLEGALADFDHAITLYPQQRKNSASARRKIFKFSGTK